MQIKYGAVYIRRCVFVCVCIRMCILACVCWCVRLCILVYVRDATI